MKLYLTNGVYCRLAESFSHRTRPKDWIFIRAYSRKQAIEKYNNLYKMDTQNAN